MGHQKIAADGLQKFTRDMNVFHCIAIMAVIATLNLQEVEAFMSEEKGRVRVRVRTRRRGTNIDVDVNRNRRAMGQNDFNEVHQGIRDITHEEMAVEGKQTSKVQHFQ